MSADQPQEDLAVTYGFQEVLAVQNFEIASIRRWDERRQVDNAGTVGEASQARRLTA